MASLTSLQSALGYVFQDLTLLGQALTHRSHGVPHNERLEFLGDSVLNFVVTTLLFAEHAEMDEGDLSRVRANLVKQAALAEIAQRLELSGHLRLGEGELKSGGFRRPSILADAVEALFGAIYIDGGYPAVRDVIEHLYRPILAHIDIRTFGKDPKTLLQEIVQGRGLSLPHYEVLATHGAAHSQLFDVECRIEKLGIQVTASGSSRRAAEQLAASQAIASIAELAPARKGARRSRKPAQLSLPVAVAQKEP